MGLTIRFESAGNAVLGINTKNLEEGVAESAAILLEASYDDFTTTISLQVISGPKRDRISIELYKQELTQLIEGLSVLQRSMKE